MMSRMLPARPLSSSACRRANPIRRHTCHIKMSAPMPTMIVSIATITIARSRRVCSMRTQPSRCPFSKLTETEESSNPERYPCAGRRGDEVGVADLQNGGRYHCANHGPDRARQNADQNCERQLAESNAEDQMEQCAMQNPDERCQQGPGRDHADDDLPHTAPLFIARLEWLRHPRAPVKAPALAGLGAAIR